jgi:DNA polymerase
VPPATTIEGLRAAAATCTACPLHLGTTQTVFGAGPPRAPIVLVGEQPGDREDRAGEPFVGPAGRLLRAVMDEVGLPPERVYLTNAVKHFKHVDRGGRRIHQKPTRGEIEACHPWLLGELSALRPRIVVALGVTAATSLLGRAVVIRDWRGELHDWAGPGRMVVTVHPSAVLRTDPEGGQREQARAGLAADLAMAAAALAEDESRR